MDLKVDEVTRVAGHIGLNIMVGKDGIKAKLVQNEFRGFESLLRNRLLEEAPLYTSRICGICQVSHALASVEAIEDGLGIIVPWEVRKLREITNLAGMVQSHLLHLFLMLAPLSLNEASLSIIGRANIRNIARSVITGRELAQKIVHEICGRSIHPIAIVPGGFTKTLSTEQISNIIALGERLSRNLSEIGEEVMPILEGERKERSVHLKTGYMYTIEGRIVVKDYNGTQLMSFKKEDYEKNIGEAEAEEGFGTYPYLKTQEITFRVGPLARLNSKDEKEAGIVWKVMRHESVMYTYARILESKLAARKIMEATAELKEEVRASPAELRFRDGEGFGAIEAPRGTLLHHYSFNKQGLIVKANVITPTALNSSVIERDIEENVQKMNSKDVGKLKERAVKVLRDYDPCIPCSTHQVRITFD